MYLLRPHPGVQRLEDAFAAAMGLALALITGAAIGWGALRHAQLPDVNILSAGDLKNLLAQGRGTATLVHVWATWCPPCREEFPNIARVHETFAGRGLSMVLISADAPTNRPAVVNYLAAQDAIFTSYIIDNPGAAFIDTLCTNWTGALPASFFLNPDGALFQWWEGQTNFAAYKQAAETLLGRNRETKK